nr:hypothetical protein [uncultured Agathobaculum sp.]
MENGEWKIWLRKKRDFPFSVFCCNRVKIKNEDEEQATAAAAGRCRFMLRSF